MVARAERTGEPLTIALIDLDRFKAYNDTHGHQAGDRLLKEAAAAWREQLRAGDLLARWGGEEFAVALPGATRRAGRARARAAARRHARAARRCRPGAASFAPGATLAELVEQADQALYAGEGRAGRDRLELVADRRPRVSASAGRGSRHIEPEAGAALRQVELAGDPEAVALVVGDVALLRRLQVGGHALVVAALEHGSHEGAADALALLGRLGPEDLEVPVRLGRVPGLDGPQRGHAHREPAAQGAHQRGRVAHELAGRGARHRRAGARRPRR